MILDAYKVVRIDGLHRVSLWIHQRPFIVKYPMNEWIRGWGGTPLFLYNTYTQAMKVKEQLNPSNDVELELWSVQYKVWENDPMPGLIPSHPTERLIRSFFFGDGETPDELLTWAPNGTVLAEYLRLEHLIRRFKDHKWTAEGCTGEVPWSAR